ncbi:hypothetical protein CURE108131_00530 [Cupriavidus respiraculi]|uniref:L-serine ammonia-lyase n=1 Tax=Cupriavidus respiraculi TaxID=195930 RepID=A0ABN7Z2Q9_9BURK|nr:hypothetical protein LMG21510_03648 [Cupriavidus respiraculi]
MAVRVFDPFKFGIGPLRFAYRALAAVKAADAARQARHGNGARHVSLDTVIRIMRETGADMLTKYKETSRGGLAVNIVAC